jgi:hypothetical protein
MTDRPSDSHDRGRHSGEISLGAREQAGESLPLGLRAVLSHARQLTRTPARESTERLGRDRLLAAAALQARPLAGGDPFGGRGAWARLRAGFAAQRSGWRTFGRWGAVAAVVCVAVLGYKLSFGATARTLPVASREKPLTYTTSGSQPAASNYLVAPAHATASLLFSDGSEVTASPGSRVRVDSTQSRGARVLLEEGVARANITHRADTNWVFVAGPFDVRITGTTFTLNWDAADQVLDLTLHEGSVEVDSPLGASRLQVKTGQRFHASVVDGTMQLLAAGPIEPLTAAASSAAEPAHAEQDSAEEAAQPRASNRTQRARSARAARSAQRRASRAERRAARSAEREESGSDADSESSVQLANASFADLVRAGAFEQVVEAATQAGLAQTLERNSAEDVRALADAARYLHRTELAVRSLTVLRARFPGSHHSPAAAFLLGRTYENAEQPQAARRFYELYERESPNGEFAAEALAGRMRVAASSDGAAAGRALAQQYLERYPRGVHAKTARHLLQ